MLVDAMERHGHLDLDPVIKTKVLQVSAATIDRVLAAARAHIDGQRKRRKGVGAAIRRSIPVRTFADWLDPPPIKRCLRTARRQQTHHRQHRSRYPAGT